MPVLCAAIAGLGACQPPRKTASPDPAAELRANNYTAAPVIVAVTQPSPATVVVTGHALPDGRVRFLYGQNRAVGVTADSQGTFSVELPIAGAGALYDLSMEDSGLLRYAEGRLFIPAGRPDKAVLLRPGAGALAIAPSSLGIGRIDYGPAGAMRISGQVAPRANVTLVVDGELWPQGASDPKGAFSAVTQISQPSTTPAPHVFAIQAGGAEWKRTIAVSLPAADQDTITPIDGGWRVDWQMPSGGVQTTLVF